MDNTSTLFTYKPGKSVETFKNASFVPMFLEDMYFANDTLRRQAEEACQGDINCLFDSASTNDVSMGASTKAVSAVLEKESSSLSKYLTFERLLFIIFTYSVVYMPWVASFRTNRLFVCVLHFLLTFNFYLSTHQLTFVRNLLILLARCLYALLPIFLSASLPVCLST